MKKWFFALFLTPLLAFAQKSAAYYAAGQFDFARNVQGYGYRVATGVPVNKTVVGLGFGVTKLNSFHTPVIPIYAHFSYCDYDKAFSPCIIIEPGYGIYSEAEKSSLWQTKGGPNIYAGAGAAFGKKLKTALIVGYSYYGFEVAGTSVHTDGFSVRVLLTGIKHFQ